MSKIACKMIMLSSLFAVLTPTLHACPQNPGFGFTVLASLLDESQPLPMYQNIGNQGLAGTFNHFLSGGLGDTHQFTGTTDGNGLLPESGKASPANWTVQFGSPEPVFDCTGFITTVDFQPNSSPQRAICTINQNGGNSLSASPSSFGVGAGNQSITLTDNTGAWPRTPASWVQYDAYGNVIDQGQVGGVSDSYDCWMYLTPYYNWNNGNGTQYVWLTDSSGTGIGYATITVTNGG